jgi:hypothetical protein
VAFQAAVVAVQELRHREETGWKPVFHDRLEAYLQTSLYDLDFDEGASKFKSPGS